MTGYASPPVCGNCGAEICGAAETRHGYGWIHQLTNRERCNPDLPAEFTNLAIPRTHQRPSRAAA